MKIKLFFGVTIALIFSVQFSFPQKSKLSNKAVKAIEAYFVFSCPSSKDTFVVKLSDPKKIQQARDILNGKEKKKVHITGINVDGKAFYNPAWNFHLDSLSVSFFQVSIEECDASIRYVEDNFNKPGSGFGPGKRWCPWCSVLLREMTKPSSL